MELKVYDDIKIFGRDFPEDLESVLTKGDFERLWSERSKVPVEIIEGFTNITPRNSNSDASIYNVYFTGRNGTVGENGIVSNIKNHSSMLNIDNSIDFMVRRTGNRIFTFYAWPRNTQADMNIRYSEYLNNFATRTSLRSNCRLYQTTFGINASNDCYITSGTMTQDSIAPFFTMQITRDYLGINNIIPKRYEISAYTTYDSPANLLLSVRKIG